MNNDDPFQDTQIVDVSESLDADASESLIGRVLAGKYRILRKLARGGMGVVYVAEHVTLGREVVFKVLSYHLSEDKKAKSRFEREARGLSVLDHPNIVTVHDFGHESSLTYIVMEYVPGENLSQKLRRKGRIPFDELVPILIQTIDALAAAHEKGIVHRDVKPSNVMVTRKAGRDDFVKVLDFGLAKLATSSVDITKGNLVGTVSYLAPEVIKGKDASPASDVYSLGVMFYYLLAGAKPFAASDDMSVLYQHVNVMPDPLHELVPLGEAPPEFLDFIHRCMEKDPTRRPQDAAQMRRQLADVVSLPSISAFSIDSSSAIPRYRPPDSSAETVAPNRPIRQTSPPMKPLRPSGSHGAFEEHSMSRSQLSFERVRKRNRNRVIVIAFTTASLGLVLLLALGVGNSRSKGDDAVEIGDSPPPNNAVAPPVEKVASALFELHTTPAGDVYVDGEPFGKTPATLELPPGTHAVSVAAKGHQEWTQKIELGAGERRRVDVFLTRDTAPSGVVAKEVTTTVVEPVVAAPKAAVDQEPVDKAPVRRVATPGEPPPTDAQAADSGEVATPTLPPKDKKNGLLPVEENRGGLLKVD